jgi:hypothetical protein
MKKKKISSILAQSVLETEFFLLSSNSKKVNISILSISISKSTALGLDIFELIKNLKQLIRTMQFLNIQKNRNLVLCSSNKNIASFLRFYQNELKLSKFIDIQSNLTKIISNLNLTQSLLLFEDSSKKSLKKHLGEKVSIVSKINSKVESKNSGTYKVYNDTSNYKKLAFIVALLYQVFDKKNNNS